MFTPVWPSYVNAAITLLCCCAVVASFCWSVRSALRAARRQHGSKPAAADGNKNKRLQLRNHRFLRLSYLLGAIVYVALKTYGYVGLNGSDLTPGQVLGLIVSYLVVAVVSWSTAVTLVPYFEVVLMEFSHIFSATTFTLYALYCNYGDALGVMRGGNHVERIISYNLFWLLEDAPLGTYAPLLASMTGSHLIDHLEQAHASGAASSKLIGLIALYAALGVALPLVSHRALRYGISPSKLPTPLFSLVCATANVLSVTDLLLRTPSLTHMFYSAATGPVGGGGVLQLLTSWLMDREGRGGQGAYGLPVVGMCCVTGSLLGFVLLSCLLLSLASEEAPAGSSSPAAQLQLTLRKGPWAAHVLDFLCSLSSHGKNMLCIMAAVAIMQVGSVAWLVAQSLISPSSLTASLPGLLVAMGTGVAVQVAGVLQLVVPLQLPNRPRLSLDSSSAAADSSLNHSRASRKDDFSPMAQEEDDAGGCPSPPTRPAGLGGKQLRGGGGSAGADLAPARGAAHSALAYSISGRGAGLGGMRGSGLLGSEGQRALSVKTALHRVSNESEGSVTSWQGLRSQSSSLLPDSPSHLSVRIEALANFKTFMQGLHQQVGMYTLEEFIQGAATAISGIFPQVHHASFCLLNSARTSVNMYTFLGEGSSKPPRMNVAVAPGTLIFHVLNNCTPMFISNTTNFPGPYSDVQFMRFVLGLRSVACLPLVMANARILGVLRLGFKDMWHWAEQEKSIAKQLALVLSSGSQGIEPPPSQRTSLADAAPPLGTGAPPPPQLAPAPSQDSPSGQAGAQGRGGQGHSHPGRVSSHAFSLSRASDALQEAVQEKGYGSSEAPPRLGPYPPLGMGAPTDSVTDSSTLSRHYQDTQGRTSLASTAASVANYQVAQWSEQVLLQQQMQALGLTSSLTPPSFAPYTSHAMGGPGPPLGAPPPAAAAAAAGQQSVGQVGQGGSGPHGPASTLAQHPGGRPGWGAGQGTGSYDDYPSPGAPGGAWAAARDSTSADGQPYRVAGPGSAAATPFTTTTITTTTTTTPAAATIPHCPSEQQRNSSASGRSAHHAGGVGGGAAGAAGAAALPPHIGYAQQHSSASGSGVHLAGGGGVAGGGARWMGYAPPPPPHHTLLQQQQQQQQQVAGQAGQSRQLYDSSQPAQQLLPQFSRASSGGASNSRGQQHSAPPWQQQQQQPGQLGQLGEVPAHSTSFPASASQQLHQLHHQQAQEQRQLHYQQQQQLLQQQVHEQEQRQMSQQMLHHPLTSPTLLQQQQQHGGQHGGQQQQQSQELYRQPPTYLPLQGPPPTLPWQQAPPPPPPPGSQKLAGSWDSQGREGGPYPPHPPYPHGPAYPSQDHLQRSWDHGNMAAGSMARPHAPPLHQGQGQGLGLGVGPGGGLGRAATTSAQSWGGVYSGPGGGGGVQGPGAPLAGPASAGLYSAAPPSRQQLQQMVVGGMGGGVSQHQLQLMQQQQAQQAQQQQQQAQQPPHYTHHLSPTQTQQQQQQQVVVEQQGSGSHGFLHAQLSGVRESDTSGGASGFGVVGGAEAIAAAAAPAQSMADIKMLEVVGRGGFGSVYKAFWRGRIVAVKVLEHGDDLVGCSDSQGNDKAIDTSGRRAALLEGAMTSTISHPNVVATFDYRVVHLNPLPSKMGHGLSSNNRVLQETHIIMEFCDRGSLQDAMEQGVFLKDKHARPASGKAAVDMELLSMTLCEVACAMDYLHTHRITHRDLKPKNVLLRSSTKDKRGFSAKVSDFGLSQVLPDNTHTQVSQKYSGTVTHMPPELIEDGKVYPQGDVYAFGIMMWEAYTGATPYVNMAHPQIMVAVVTHNLRPKFPDTCPEWYKTLAYKCWRKDPKLRPVFSDITAYLLQMIGEREWQPAVATTTAKPPP